MISPLDPPRYAAVYAKVHTRFSQLLSPGTWEDLLSASDLPEFIRRLEGTPYRAVVDLESDEGVDLAHLERSLRGHSAQAVRSLLRFMPPGPRDLLAWRWRRFELDNLKTVLRAVKRQVDPERARATLVPLGEASAIPWEVLLEARSVSAVVDRLTDTFYGRALEPALDRYHREDRLFVLEVRLDLVYFRRLLEKIEGLGGQDRKEAERFLGIMIDSQNVLWAFRYREYYGLSPEEILNYSLHRGVKVDVSTIRRVAQGASLLAVMQDVWDGILSGLDRLEGLSDEEALVHAEGIFDRFMFKQARQVRTGYAMHLGIVLGYDVMLETEVGDLVTIAEGKAGGWSAQQIRPYLTVGSS